MAPADTTSHASLNGLYVKAQELDRGHCEAPAWKIAPPGASLDGDQVEQAGAESHATSSPTARADVRADYSRDFQIVHRKDPRRCTIEFRCFDTDNRVTVFSSCMPSDCMEQALLGVRSLCLELHMLWSFSIEGSDVSRINEKARRTDVDPRTADLLDAMGAFNRIEPLYDFTIGRLSYLWKHATKVPADKTLRALAALTGASKVHVEGNAIVKDDERVQVDVGGSAKGAAADLAGALLREAGVVCAEIDLGGNLLTIGSHPEGRPWRLAIMVPPGMDVRIPRIEAIDESAVTSGSYERFVEIDDKRYQHIVDPRTGKPAESDIVSATVVGPSSLQADMLATTACIAGSEGLAGIADRHPGYRFTAILEDGSVVQAP